MAELRVGDPVILLEDFCGLPRNRTGVIVGVTWGSAAVKLDERWYAGHSCNGLCPVGYGWNIPTYILRLHRPAPLTPFDRAVQDYIQRELNATV